MKLTESQKCNAAQLCVDIYMSIHVSELRHLRSFPIEKAWELGQKIRADTVNGQRVEIKWEQNLYKVKL